MKLSYLVPAAALGLCFAIPVLSQDGTKPAKPAAAVAQAEKPAKKPTVRLPNNYGKIDLTDEQKDAVRTALSKYNEQIDELEQQILALREKRDAEVYAVLTDEQKKKLAELEGAAKKKKADKAATGKPSADE